MILNLNLSPLSKFRRDVQLLMIASAILSVTFFGIQQLLKVLYVLRLGYDLHFVGLFSATGALGYMAMSIPSGALSNRFGHRVVILAGGITTVLGMVILPLTEMVPAWGQSAWLILAQVVTTAGWAMFSVNQVPALMSLTTPQNRNQAYAFSSMFRSLGTFVGTICGGLLPGFFAYLFSQALTDPAPYRLALWVGAGVGLIGVGPLWWIQEGQEDSESPSAEAEKQPFPTWPLLLMLTYIYLSHGGRAACEAFCSAYMDTGLHLSTAAIGLITGVGQFTAILAPLLAPRLAKRYSNGWILIVTAVGTTMSLSLLFLLTHWAAVGLGRLGIMTLSAIWMPAFQVYQMELISSRWRSLVFGIVSMMLGLTFASISLAGGYIATEWGYRTLFFVGATISLLGATLMWFIHYQRFGPAQA
jgi:MFS family permease